MYDQQSPSQPQLLKKKRDRSRSASAEKKIASAFRNASILSDNGIDALSVIEPNIDVLDIPESASRRKLELRLLHNYVVNICHTFPACHNNDVVHSYTVEAPQLALEYDNLLYGILSISTRHLLQANPHDSELIAARTRYHGLAMREQRKAVAELKAENADPLCFASVLILIDAFASLQERVIEPYTPPMNWLQMARGAGSVFDAGFKACVDHKASKVWVLVKAEPFLYDIDLLFSDSNRDRFSWLLRPSSEETWDDETRIAYEKAVAYIGSIQLSVENEEHLLAVGRRLMAFALIIPNKFIRFVEEMRPRALVILSHYFAFAIRLEGMWWMGGCARREIGAIKKAVSYEWQMLMVGPLSAVGLKPEP